MKDKNFLSNLAGNIAERIASYIIKDEYEEIITLKFCIQMVKQECAENPDVRYFTLTVNENEEPENENDNFTVRITMKDKSMKALSRGYIFHAGEVDDNIRELLGGRNSITVKI